MAPRYEAKTSGWRPKFCNGKLIILMRCLWINLYIFFFLSLRMFWDVYCGIFWWEKHTHTKKWCVLIIYSFMRVIKGDYDQLRIGMDSGVLCVKEEEVGASVETHLWHSCHIIETNAFTLETLFWCKNKITCRFRFHHLFRRISVVRIHQERHAFVRDGDSILSHLVACVFFKTFYNKKQL